MNVGDLNLERQILACAADLDARAGDGDWNPIQGGQLVREHLFTPAGVLIPSSYAGMLAQPTFAPYWNAVIPQPASKPPGQYL